MKKLLLILILVLTGSSYAQFKTLPFWNNSFVPHAQQYFARYDTRPTGDTLKWYNDFIYTMDSSGIWSKIDEMWFFANNTAANSLLGVKNYKNVTAVNSPTFTAYRGYVSNGTTSYLSTNYNPTTDAVSLSTNSISFGAYSRTDATSINALMGIVGSGPSRYMYIYPRYTGNIFYFTPNSTTDVSVSNSDSRGLFASNRSSSSNAEAYRNGTQLLSVSSTSSTLINGNVYICALNKVGTGVGSYTTRQISFAWIGGSLTSTQHSILYTALQRLMTRIGANV